MPRHFRHFKVRLFFGRIWSELSFEEKVFVHAELTPMAKPKKPIVTTTKVGLVKVQIKTAVDIHTGRTPPEVQDILHKGKAYCCLLTVCRCRG